MSSHLKEAWRSHRDEWHDCSRCGLARTRTRICLGKGNLQPDWLLVGIGPGKREDETGVVFRGPAGTLLSFCIRRAVGDAGHRRCFFLNLVACRPTDDGRSNRDPTRQEMDACWERLTSALYIVRPRRGVILLGGLAASRLSEGDWLGGMVVHRVRHPAYVLRRMARDRSARDRYVERLKEAMS